MQASVDKHGPNLFIFVKLLDSQLGKEPGEATSVIKEKWSLRYSITCTERMTIGPSNQDGYAWMSADDSRPRGTPFHRWI